MDDFALSDELSVESVRTLLDKSLIGTNEDIENVLINKWNDLTIKHHEENEIRYTRINHIDYKYHILVNNPQRQQKKVIIRIFLGSCQQNPSYTS